MAHLLNRYIPLLFLTFSFIIPLSASANPGSKDAAAQFTQLEGNMSNGRLAVFALDTKNGEHLNFRANETFPVASTFKVLLAADILARSAQNEELMHQHIKYTKDELVTHSPVTEKHVDAGMTVAELLDAMVKYSDNTATNLLMKIVGGPVGVTKFAQSIGNHDFRLDNWEANLNTDSKNLQDTCTPESMAHSLQKLVLGDFLKDPQRKQLENGLLNNTVAPGLIRAGVPSDWKVGDRSGGGSYGTRNDLAVLWPPNRAPIILAIYTNHDAKEAKQREDIIAAATRVVVDWAQRN